ncbi:hypothetical protein GCM10009127_05310 [Alteraurantiacibacter aestuarii]
MRQGGLSHADDADILALDQVDGGKARQHAGQTGRCHPARGTAAKDDNSHRWPNAWPKEWAGRGGSSFIHARDLTSGAGARQAAPASILLCG